MPDPKSLLLKFTLYQRQALDAAGIPRFKIFRDAVINLVAKLDREPVTVKDVFDPNGEHTDEKLRGMAGFVAHRVSQRGQEVSPVAVFGDPQITAASRRDEGLELEFTVWLAFGLPTDADDRGLGPI